MKILITNDDGWDAPGLKALCEVARDFGDIAVVAPKNQQSGVSHQLTLDRPIELVQRAPDVWSLDGTPADCVRIAVTQMEDFKFDLVLSGINNGGNLGADVFVSGTVAAARESAIHGVPAIAISQHRLRYSDPYDWTFTREVADRILKHCMKSLPGSDQYFNINLPDFCDFDQVPNFEIVDPAALDRSPLPVKYETSKDDDAVRFTYAGKYRDRLRTPGSDIDVCFSKNVSLTRLSLP